ncbi:MAG: TRAP transporter large permease subunit [Deltaproteobacteria bacterium]|nr:TRAP transporter large permease subunit [Deltaproteobacteria bacterium]
MTDEVRETTVEDPGPANGGETSHLSQAEPEHRKGGIWNRVVASATKLGHWLTLATEMAVVFVLLAETVAVFSCIILRAFFHINLDWVLEISEFAIVFLTFVGCVVAYRRNDHMRIHFVVDALPQGIRPYIAAAVDMIVFMVSLILVYTSYDMLGGDETTPIMDVPIAWLRSPLFVGAVLMAVFSFGKLFTHRPKVLLSVLPVVAAVSALFISVVTSSGLSPNLALFITLAGFALLLVMAVPIGFVFVSVSFLYVQQMKAGMMLMVPLHMHHAASAFVMLAVPFFVLAGMVMTEGGLAKPMSDFIVSLIGRFRGGLYQVMVVGMYIFSGISGSKVADMVAVGTSLSDMLKHQGYPKGETGAVLSSAAAMGETVPPSIPMLVLGSVSTLSIATLFVAGLIPAAMIAFCLMIAIYLRAGKLGLKGVPPTPFREMVRKGIVSIPAFAMPLILVVGILTGVSTPTEVSTFAVVYGIGTAFLLYRTMTGKAFWKVLKDSASMTGNVLFVVCSAAAFSWGLTYAQVPQKLAESVLVMQGQPWLFMLACLILLVVMGSVLEGLPVILIFAPIFLPIVHQFGINPLHFGIVMIIAMGIGLFSPPIGIGIYFAAAIAETTVEEATRPMLYYIVVLLIGLLLVAFIPELTLWLPRLIGLRF